MSSSVSRHAVINRDMGHRPASEATPAGRAHTAENAGFAPAPSRGAAPVRTPDPRRTPPFADVTDLEPHWAMAIDAATD